MDKNEGQNQEEYKEVDLVRKYTVRLDGNNLDKAPDIFDKEKLKEQIATGPSITSVRVTDYTEDMMYQIQKFRKEKAEKERLKKEQEETTKTNPTSHQQKIKSRSHSSSSEMGK